MKCNEYNTYSVLCQGCDYPLNIKCCKKLDMRELTEKKKKLVIRDCSIYQRIQM